MDYLNNMAELPTVMAQTVCQDETTSSSQCHQGVIDRFKNTPTNCLRHKDREVSLFCRTCDWLVCTSCIIEGYHSDHTFCEVEHVAKEKRTQLRNELDNSGKEIYEHIQKIITHTEQEKELTTEKCKNTSENIEKQKTSLIQEIETWSQGLQTTVTDYQTVKLTCLNDRLVQSDTCLSLLKIFQQDPEFVDTFNGTKSIQALEILHNITNPPKKLHEKPLSFLPGSGFQDGNMSSLFGSLTGMTCETQVSDNTCSEDVPQGNSVVVDTDEASDSDQDSTDTESVYEDVVCLETKYKCTKSRIDRIAPVHVNSAFIVVKNKLYLVDFNKHKGDIEKEEPLLTDVVHITPVTEKGIYIQQKWSNKVSRVTTKGKVYHFVDTVDDALQCIGLSESGQVILSTHRSYTEYAHNKSCKKTVREFSEYDQNGVIIKTLKTQYYDDYPRPPPYVFDIVLTNSTLYVLNTAPAIPDKPTVTGNVINVLQETTYSGVIGRVPESRFNPRGMCKDKDGRLVVTDYWNHAVHLLTPEGKFCKFLMREEDGLTDPTAVAIDNYQQLWVGQCDGTIHIIKYVIAHLLSFNLTNKHPYHAYHGPFDQMSWSLVFWLIRRNQ